MKNQTEALLIQAASQGGKGDSARRQGDLAAAETHFHRALDLALQAGRLAGAAADQPARLEAWRLAAGFALDGGQGAEARRLLAEASATDPALLFSEQWTHLFETGSWPDEWLVACIRRDPPDALALEELAGRYWKPLFGRCHLLTLDHEKAADLTQEAWCRFLRNRHALRPGGNIQAYLNTIATNLWRDRGRSARRAGPLSEQRLESLDAPPQGEEDNSFSRLDGLADLKSRSPEDEALLALDLDRALGHLTPLLREVLLARYIDGESCLEIGLRHGRTEQCVSGWVRQALQIMRTQLQESNAAECA